MIYCPPHEGIPRVSQAQRMAYTGLGSPGILQGWLESVDLIFRFIPDFEQSLVLQTLVLFVMTCGFLGLQHEP